MAGSTLAGEGVPTTSKTQNSVNGLGLSMKLLHLYENGFSSTPYSSVYNSKSNKTKQWHKQRRKAYIPHSWS
jgi:hypothetical protein